MKKEIEIRFLDVDYDGLRNKLRDMGATLTHPMQFMRRVIIDYPDQRLQNQKGSWSFVRVRDEGGRVLLTYKFIVDNEQYDTHEIEIEVSSFDKTIEFFEAIGLEVISEQHTRREAWEFRGCEISLDDWPWLSPMVEIEGPDEAALKRVARNLGLPWHDAMYGNVVLAYRKMYPKMTDEESIRSINRLTFEVMPEWLKERA